MRGSLFFWSLMLPCFPMSGTAAQSEKAAVSAASATFAITMAANETYLLSADCNICFLQSAAPTAVDATTAGFLAAGQQMLIDGSFGAKLAVIGHVAATGFAFLQRVKL